MNNKNRLFEKIYQESNRETTKMDTVELITDFVNKMRSLIYQAQFVIDCLNKEIEKY